MDDVLTGAVQQLLVALLAALLTVVGGFLVAWLNKLREKVSLEAAAYRDARTRALVQNAIHATDERARADDKKHDPGNGVDEKMSATVSAVLTTVPNVTRAEAETLINEELPKARAVTA